MKTHTKKLSKIRKELISLVVSGRISETTFKNYLSIAEKLLYSPDYLKKSFSKGHMRRIQRVLSIINRVFQIFKKTMSGGLYRVISGFYSVE